MKKHSLILVMLIACSSCSLKYLFVKKEPTPTILSSAANAKSDCAKGIGESCYQYIKIYDEYKLGFKDDEAASTDLAILLTNVCIEKKANELCPIAVRVSYRYDNAPLLTRICFSTKDADSCSSAAKASFSKETFDQKLGLKALAYSCVKPNSYDCKWLLQKSIELKDGKYLAEKCNAGNSESCLHAGMYGRELKEDPRLRLKFYEKACALGEKEGCEFAQLIPKSIVMYDCESKKSIKSCREASELLMKESMDEARKFAQLGCNANDKVSCAQVGKIDTLIAEKKREEAAAWAAVAQGFAAGLQAGAQTNSYQPVQMNQQNSNSGGGTPARVPSSGKYIGNLNSNKYDPNSVSNPYGQYGSKYSPDSINNPYGAGNPYSNKKVKLYDQNGNFKGNLNNNRYDPDSVSNPYGRYGSKYSPDSINNPYGAGNPYDSNSPRSPSGQGLQMYQED